MQATPEDMIFIGLSKLRKTNFELVSRRHQFRRLFGSSADTCSQLWNDLVAEGKVMRGGPYFFLLTLTWLRNYQTELDLATTYGHDEDTLRSYFWFYVESIQSLQRTKVRFLSFYSFQINQTN